MCIRWDVGRLLARYSVVGGYRDRKMPRAHLGRSRHSPLLRLPVSGNCSHLCFIQLQALEIQRLWADRGFIHTLGHKTRKGCR